MIRHRVVANGPATARLDFFVDDFNKLWSLRHGRLEVRESAWPRQSDSRVGGIRETLNRSPEGYWISLLKEAKSQLRFSADPGVNAWARERGRPLRCKRFRGMRLWRFNLSSS